MGLGIDRLHIISKFILCRAKSYQRCFESVNQCFKDRQQSLGPILVRSAFSLLIAYIHTIYYLKAGFSDYLMI